MVKNQTEIVENEAMCCVQQRIDGTPNSIVDTDCYQTMTKGQNFTVISVLLFSHQDFWMNTFGRKKTGKRLKVETNRLDSKK